MCGGKEHKTNTNDVAKIRKETNFNEWSISLNKQNKGKKNHYFLVPFGLIHLMALLQNVGAIH